MCVARTQVTNQTNDTHSTGFLASYLVFSTPGCWEVTAQVGDREDSKLTFITRVKKVGEGPDGGAEPR